MWDGGLAKAPRFLEQVLGFNLTLGPFHILSTVNSKENIYSFLLQ